MVELIITTLGGLGTAFFLYLAKRDRMKRDERLIDRANPKDMAEIARALNPSWQLGLFRRKQVPPGAATGDEPDHGS